jgi:hypothetical protein
MRMQKVFMLMLVVCLLATSAFAFVPSSDVEAAGGMWFNRSCSRGVEIGASGSGWSQIILYDYYGRIVMSQWANFGGGSSRVFQHWRGGSYGYAYASAAARVTHVRCL